MKNYEINDETLAIIPVGEKKSKVFEKDCSFIIEKNVNSIMDESCKYYGSSISGRQKGTEKLTGISYKAPIVVKEDDNIIFFPTSSPRLKKCSWVALNNIDSYYYDFERNKCIIVFDNNEKVEFDMSYCILNNQVLRSHKLNTILNKRKS